MLFDGGIITISAAIKLLGVLFHVFKRVFKWLKRRANTLWKEDHRILKIVRDYISRNRGRIQDEKLPEYIHVLVVRLKERKSIQWMQAPGAAEAESEAQTIHQYQDPGYIVDIELSGDETGYSEVGEDEDVHVEEEDGEDSDEDDGDNDDYDDDTDDDDDDEAEDESDYDDHCDGEGEEHESGEEGYEVDDGEDYDGYES
ncbi:hypothetical protein SLS54_009014 [Diplodia seriata]